MNGWEDYLKRYKNINVKDLSHNPNITLEHVLSNPNIRWDYSNLSHNENIPINYIIKTFNKYRWKLSGLHERIYFSELYRLEELLNSKSLKLDYQTLSYNRSIPFSYVLKNWHKDWNWSSIIEHILTEYDYQKYTDKCEKILLKYSYFVRQCDNVIIYQLNSYINYLNGTKD